MLGGRGDREQSDVDELDPVCRAGHVAEAPYFSTNAFSITNSPGSPRLPSVKPFAM
jgi:hypothetical protein